MPDPGLKTAHDLEITMPAPAGCEDVLGTEALAFANELFGKFEGRRQELLQARQERYSRMLAGELPDFLPQTAPVRQGKWRISPVPEHLLDRRVEITGPVDRKMIINALNSGANVFMADFEDSNSPYWNNNIEGQRNLADAIRGTITFKSPEGKDYQLKERTATLFVRPRGWHLNEKHVLREGRPVSASLFDFALYFFGNVRALQAKGAGVYLYLPKLESHLEARLWNEVFDYSEDRLQVPRGTVRATVLIETILGAFEMDEILFELREHSAGLNCGRWDYIFSFIKKLGHRPEFVLPDRAQVTMDKAFLKAYVELLIQTCHRRGAHAMGGMAAQIPIRNDVDANEAAMEKVRADKLREVRAGHDGTWVAHPGLVPIAKEIFDAHMTGPNQLGVMREDVNIGSADLLKVHEGQITEQGLRHNLDVGLQYLEAWLKGLGCVPIYNLMEDAATAEICRAQVWQWVRHGQKLQDGRQITPQLARTLLQEQVAKLRQSRGDGRLDDAASILGRLIESERFVEFLTLPAYELLP